MFAPGHLGELIQIVPFEMVDAVLAERGAVQRRLRKLPARVVVYLLLAAALFEGCGYPAVWSRLTAAPTAGSLPPTGKDRDILGATLHHLDAARDRGSPDEGSGLVL